MARGARIEIAGGLYHVYNRVSSGEAVFADPNEAIEFIDIIRGLNKRDGWTVSLPNFLKPPLRPRSRTRI
jgi:hypothetical protein